MKRFFLLLLGLVALLLLAGCGAEDPTDSLLAAHEHIPNEGYAYDETHHWNPCTVAGCNIKMNWQAHVHDGDSVTREPTESESGIRTFSCMCGHAKTEEIPYEGMTEGEFEGALARERFQNVTLQIKATEGETELSNATLRITGNTVQISGLLNGQIVEETKDAEWIEKNLSTVLYFVGLCKMDTIYDAENRIYEVKHSFAQGETIHREWRFSEIKLKFVDDRLSMASCNFTELLEQAAVAEGVLEMTITYNG